MTVYRLRVDEPTPAAPYARIPIDPTANPDGPQVGFQRWATAVHVFTRPQPWTWRRPVDDLTLALLLGIDDAVGAIRQPGTLAQLRVARQNLTDPCTHEEVPISRHQAYRWCTGQAAKPEKWSGDLLNHVYRLQTSPRLTVVPTILAGRPGLSYGWDPGSAVRLGGGVGTTTRFGLTSDVARFLGVVRAVRDAIQRT